MTYREFATKFLACLALLFAVGYYFSIPQAQWAIRNLYVTQLSQRAQAQATKDEEIARLKAELEKAKLAPAPAGK